LLIDLDIASHIIIHVSETALAEKAQLMSQSGSMLPIIHTDDDSYILTVFWADNFDVMVDRQIGSTSVNTTHMVAFQEKGQSFSTQRKNVVVPRSRKIKLSTESHVNVAEHYVNPKVGPKKFTGVGLRLTKDTYIPYVTFQGKTSTQIF